MEAEFNVEFITATIINWRRLLQDDNCKQIVIASLQWLVQEERCSIFGFVIMPNHIHLLWRINSGSSRTEAQSAFFSFTGHQFKKYLQATKPRLLTEYRVEDADRKFMFWERGHMIKECWSRNFIIQKLAYIHSNPCQPHWQLCGVPEEYLWSSAAFYKLGDNRHPWLTHIDVH